MASVTTQQWERARNSEEGQLLSAGKLALTGRFVEEVVLELSSQASLELILPKNEMNVACFNQDQRPSEHQLKTLSNLRVHLAAPFSVNTKWIGLQNASMSIPENHCPLSDDIIFHLQNSKMLNTAKDHF